MQEDLSSCVGQEYKPQDLLFGRDNISCLTSSGVIIASQSIRNRLTNQKVLQKKFELKVRP